MPGMGPLPPDFLRPPSDNPSAAMPGAYTIDLEHCSVIARVKHAGTSFSVLRFGVTKGKLTWDAKTPAAIRLDVTVDTKPHYDPIVYRLKPESPPLLDVAQFPQASFVSTAVRPTGPRSADIVGQLTLLGVSRPAVIHAGLVGVGHNITGAATVGFTGTMVIRWADFAKSPKAGPDLGDITLVLDAEFIKA
jgi:polyisoprenoid-binding protein YceI